MKTFIKWIIYTTIALIIVIVSAVLLLITFINPNDYKADIEKSFYKQTHKHLKIPGDISFGIFPNIYLNLGNGYVLNSTKFADSENKRLIEWKKLYLNFSLFSLLSGKINIKNIILDDVNIYLQQNKIENNFSVPSKNEKLNVSSVQAYKDIKKNRLDTSNEIEDNYFSSVNLQNLSMKDITLNYFDYVNNKKFVVDNIDIDVNKNILKNGYDIVGSFKYFDNNNKLNSKFNLFAIVHDVDNIQLLNFNNNINVLFNKEEFKDIEVKFNELLFINNKISLNDFYVVNNKLGNIYINDFILNLDDKKYTGDFKYNNKDIASVINSMNLDYKIDSPINNSSKDMNLKINFNGDYENINIAKFIVSTINSELTGKAKITLSNPSNISIKYNIFSKNIDIANWVNMKGVKVKILNLIISGMIKTPDNFNNLYGNTTIKSPEIKLKGIDLDIIATNMYDLLNAISKGKNIGDAYKKFKNEALPEFNKDGINSNNNKITIFKDTYIHNVFDGKNIKTTKLKSHTNQIKLDVVGNFNLKDSSVNYDINTVMKPIGKIRAVKTNIAIPYLLTGTTDNLNFSINNNQLQKNIKPIINELIAKKITDIKIDGNLGNKLKSFFF